MKLFKRIACHFNHHSFDGCTCVVCGKERDAEHKWNGCKCSVCGKKRDTEHNWDGCKCSVCGKTRNTGHLYGKGCTCLICKSEDPSRHEWNGCVCSRCGKTRHEWKETSRDTREYFPEGVDPCLENMCLLIIEETIHYTCQHCGEEKIIET